MAEQLRSGRWAAKRVTSSATEVRIFDTQNEAEEWEG